MARDPESAARAGAARADARASASIDPWHRRIRHAPPPDKCRAHAPASGACAGQGLRCGAFNREQCSSPREVTQHRETGYRVHFGPCRAGAALPRRRRCSAGRVRVLSVPNWSQMSRARDSSSSSAGLEAPVSSVCCTSEEQPESDVPNSPEPARTVY